MYAAPLGVGHCLYLLLVLERPLLRPQNTTNTNTQFLFFEIKWHVKARGGLFLKERKTQENETFCCVQGIKINIILSIDEQREVQLLSSPTMLFSMFCYCEARA